MRRSTLPSGLLLALVFCLALPAMYGGDRIGGETGAAQLQGQIPTIAPEVIQSNTGSIVPPKPFSYRWAPVKPMAGVPNVLVYADDSFHAAPNTPVDQALQLLGYPYTAHYNNDHAGFLADLTAYQWDIVIFADDNWAPPTSATFDALAAYVASGGRLIFHSWAVNWYPGHPLYALLGVQIGTRYGAPPPPVYWLDPVNPLFNDPESVPELIHPVTKSYGTYAFNCTPLPGYDAVAAYTVGSPIYALVLGENTIFKGFLDGQFDQDDDSDGMMDITELWINMIVGIEEGFSSYDLIYVDEFGRAKLCINSQTGDYSYKVLKGNGIGEYTGQAYLSMRNGVLFINSTTLNPRLTFYDNQKFHRAYGSFTWGTLRSYLDDRSTLNNPATCN